MTIPTEWPEPGGRPPAPSAELHRIQDFVNTNDVEAGRDAIGTPQLLHAWLVAAGAMDAGSRVTRDAHDRALAVREGIRALGLANNGEPLDQQRLAAMNRAAARLPMVPAITGSAAWRLEPATHGVDGFLSGLLSTLVSAMADGSWSRMKACRNDACKWLFFDQSRNRSGTWCTMAICGSRMKSRAYRARQHEESPAT